MERQDFDFYWDNLFKPIVEDIKKKTSPGSLHFSDRKMVDVWLRYEQVRKNVKSKMPTNQSEEKYMDRHKIAACLMCAFLDCPLWSVKIDKPSSIVEKRPNEIFAYRVGLTFHFNFLNFKLQKYKEEGNLRDEYKLDCLREFLNSSFQKYLPKCSELDYQTHFSRTFIYKKNNLDIFAYSLILHQLEEHVFLDYKYENKL